MNIEFAKAQAAGNDFIILDNRKNRLGGGIANFSDFAAFACRRRYSVGADGVLVLEDSASADFKMRIFNPDGSEVPMCGNGARSSAAFCYAKEWCGASMKIETKSGVLAARIKNDLVKIKMTPPKNIRLERNVGLGNTIMDLHTLDTGVPHAVHFVENIKGYPVKEMGAKLRYHKAFHPEGTNADFVEAVDRSTISVRTYERGVEDETLACGTGAVASAIISCLVKGTEQPVSVVTAGGEVLKIYFKKERNNFHDVYLEGKATISFEGGLDYV